MKISPTEMMLKFPFLNKFKDHSWFLEEASKYESNHKELPMKITFLLIEDMLKFIEETKFINMWEEGFSLKIRLQHAKDLLSFLCEDTEEEKTIKGSFLK